MHRTPWLCAIAVTATIIPGACSSSPSGSGVDRTKQLTQLSASDRDRLCSYAVDIEKGPRTVDCGNMISVMVEDKAACVSGFAAVSIQCQATVADAEDCFQAFGDKPCDVGGGACTTLFTCVSPSGT